MAKETKSAKPAAKTAGGKKTKTEKTEKTEKVKSTKKEAPAEKKQGMDPKKKKMIIIWSCVGGGVLLLVIVAIVLIISLTKVDYVEAYGYAKDLKSEVYDLSNSSCSSVVNYASSTYTSEKEYNKYIDKCKESSNGADELVTKLEQTTAVQRDESIKRDFEKFKKEYDEVVGSSEKKENAMKIYQTWHQWILKSDDLDDYDESDADLEAAAKILTESGNDELKEYGETWLNYRKELGKTYRAYKDTSWSADNYNEVYDAYSKARTDYTNWYYKNKIKISDVADWTVESYSDLYAKCNTLYETIENAYQQAGAGGGNNPFGIDPSQSSGSDSSDGGSYSDIMKMLGQ